MDKRYEDIAESMMTTTPVTVGENARLDQVLELMENPERRIYAVPVADEENRLLGVVRMHDVLGA